MSDPAGRVIGFGGVRVGYGSAVLCALFSVAYVGLQVAEWMGLLGSAGGPGSASTAAGIALLLTPSLLLAPSFVALMAAVHDLAPEGRRVWSRLGLSFATIYAVLVSFVYFVQLTFVLPRMLTGRTEGIELLLFEPFDSFLYSVDLLGYSMMSLATLFASAVFSESERRPERLARSFLFANGLLLPFLALQIYLPPLIWAASLWAVTFPGASISLAVVFARRRAGFAGSPAELAVRPSSNPPGRRQFHG